MKFTQEERATIHKLLVVNRNAEFSRAAANMIFFGPVSSGLEVKLNAQANRYDEEVAEMMVKLFGADDFAEVMEDYEKYLDKNRE